MKKLKIALLQNIGNVSYKVLKMKTQQVTMSLTGFHQITADLQRCVNIQKRAIQICENADIAEAVTDSDPSFVLHMENYVLTVVKKTI